MAPRSFGGAARSLATSFASWALSARAAVKGCLKVTGDGTA
jgi:hypothetical protein